MIRVISSDLHMHGESDQMKRPAIIMSTLMRSEIANVPFVDNKTGARRHTLVDSIAFLSRLQHTQSQKQTSATAALQTGASSARSFPGNGYDVEESRWDKYDAWDIQVETPKLQKCKCKSGEMRANLQALWHNKWPGQMFVLAFATSHCFLWCACNVVQNDTKYSRLGHKQRRFEYMQANRKRKNIRWFQWGLRAVGGGGRTNPG